MKKVLLIINPTAGKKRSKGAMFDIISRFCEAGWTVSVQTTLYAGHAAEVTEKSCGDYDLIVCAGGDGTLNEVITGTQRAKSGVEIGYIPCGSTNDFARSVGLSTNISRATDNIIENDSVGIDVGRFNDRFFSYIASFGAFSSTSYSTPQGMKNALGHMAYMLSAVQDISKIHPCRMKVEYGEDSLEEDMIFGCVSNSTSVAGVVKLKESIVDITDGLFEVILARYPRNPAEVSRIIHGLTSSTFDDPLFMFFKTAGITFETAGDVPWSLDGEYQPSVPRAEIRNVHHGLKLRK